MAEIRQEFSRGTLSIETDDPDAFHGMFGFGERINPKRPFLFVNRRLGRHIPARPKDMNALFFGLAAKIPLPDGMFHLFIGLAEMASCLGAGVFRACDAACSIYLASTRLRFRRELLASFSEDHSHAAGHFLYRPKVFPPRGTPIHLILIDDEITTGRTLDHLEGALSFLDIRMATRVAVADWSGTGDAVSLMRGRWRFEGGCSQEMPADAEDSGKVLDFPDRGSGRFGLCHGMIDPWPDVHAMAGERILVLGTGEFAWPPFLLAERLEREGADAFCAATTRSPAQMTMDMKTCVPHRDSHGLGVANYLYNFDAERYDRVLLCPEAGTPDPALVRALGGSMEILR